jgi:hypothetical protein
MKLSILLFSTLCAISSIDGHAQDTTRVSLHLNEVTFEEFAHQIEQQTQLRFYYKPVWTDSLSITVSVQNQQVNAVMEKILEGTDLRYAIDENKNVYITRERNILTILLPDFFNTSASKPRAVTFDYSDYEKREQKTKSMEEKLYTIGISGKSLEGLATLKGRIATATSGEPVIGASVFVEDLKQGAVTDQLGIYSLTIPKGRHTLRIASMGMKSTHRRVMIYNNGKFDIELMEDIKPLREVVVESDRDARVMSVQMGTEKLDIKTMKQMPSVLGETDVLKIVLTLPGVQTVGEGASGVNIRGGATNQNLILFNDAVVYNPSHLFGFFSAFNPDVLKSVELYKSGINAEYGGRLSAVLDVTSREGNLKKFSASGGISPVTGRLMIEGPIKKDKTSFLFGARSTYSNWLLRRVKAQEIKNSEASFYDLNFNLNHKVNDKNSLHLSAYQSGDRFTLNSDTAYAYSDRNAAIKWKHVFSPKLYGVGTGSYSQYEYDVSSDENPANAFLMKFGINQLTAKADFSYFQNPQQTINAGIHIILYELTPGTLKPSGEESLILPDVLPREQALEYAFYAGENFEITPKLSVYAGVRYSLYQYSGPRDVYTYNPEISRSQEGITDTVSYSRGQRIVTYHGAEPRFLLRYLTGKNSSVKLSYNRMRQYIQMLSNTTAIAPTDTWKLSDPYIKPQIGDQFSAGYYQNLKGGSIEVSAEVYYKVMQNSLDFKDGAVLLLNHHIETDVVNADGKAYGAEFMIKKAAGKFNGWITYTYSRSFLRTQNPFAAETVNSGKYYPTNYDKPHAANFIGNYKFNRRFNFSLNVTYSTGRPITIPLAKYEIDGGKRLYYSERNAFRIPDYFRTDFSVNVEGNHKIKKLAHSSWTFAIYNLTGRKNAYSVFFVSENGRINGYKLSVFARPIPTITYNFKF